MATTHKQDEITLENVISNIRELHGQLEHSVLDILTGDEHVISDQVRSVSAELAVLAHALVPAMVARGRAS